MTFIDESGEAGLSEGSSPYYRLAAVCFEQPGHIDSYRLALDQLKAILNVSPCFEFHFARMNHKRKLEFFEAVARENFRFVVSSFDKNIQINHKLKKEEIYESCIGGLVRQLEPVYREAELQKEGVGGLNEKIVFDQCGDANFMRCLKASFWRLKSARGENKKLVADIKPGKSVVEIGVQLADMLCGPTGRYLEGDDLYFNLIRHKLIAIERSGKNQTGVGG